MPLKNQVLILDFAKKSEQMRMKEDFYHRFLQRSPVILYFLLTMFKYAPVNKTTLYDIFNPLASLIKH